MTTVGFNFTKMVAERKPASEQNIRIENNVGVTNIEEANVLDPKRSLIKFDFNFICKYEPGLGSIELIGELVEMFDKELSGKIIESWKKDKKIHPEIMARVLNSILTKANIEAIVLSRELGLPSPIQMPKVEIKPRIEELKKAEPKKEEAKKEEAKVKVDKKK